MNQRAPDSEAPKVTFNRDNKFDLQLSASLIRERALGDMFRHAIFDGARDVKIELKSETWQWERTGNICIEFRQNGQPSGIAITDADVWVHELRRDDKTLVWLMFPIERLLELARDAYRRGHYHEGGGDGGRFCNVLIPLREILK
jgi:hypothetical protein